MRSLRLLPAALVALALVASGCGGDGTGERVDVESFVVNVEVTEFSVTPNPSSAAAGPIAFGVRNGGGITHEFVVIQTDLAEDALPVAGNVVDEDGEGITIINKIEEVPAGGSVILRADLEAGAYVLICNISTHYESGMRAAFEVA
ncbi:MAG: hypothetical protein ACRDH6_03125 [Actinomycetota bacterium]